MFSSLQMRRQQTEVNWLDPSSIGESRVTGYCGEEYRWTIPRGQVRNVPTGCRSTVVAGANTLFAFRDRYGWILGCCSGNASASTPKQICRSGAI
jgi:hypothetical protein